MSNDDYRQTLADEIEARQVSFVSQWSAATNAAYRDAARIVREFTGVPNPERVAAAKARVIADKKRGVVTPQWIKGLADE